jgi:hypothetical protein
LDFVPQEILTSTAPLRGATCTAASADARLVMSSSTPLGFARTSI